MKFFKDTLPYLLYGLLCFYVLKNWIFYKQPETKTVPLDYSGQVYNYPKTELEMARPDTTVNFDSDQECPPEEFYTLSTPNCDFVLSTLGGCLTRVEYKGALTSNGKPIKVNYGERFVRARQGAGPVGTLGLLTTQASPVNYNKVSQTVSPDGKEALLFVAQNEHAKIEKLFWVGERPYEINMSFKITSKENQNNQSTARIILCPLSTLESVEPPQAIFYDWNAANFNKQTINVENNQAVKLPNYFGLESKYFVSLLQCQNEKGETNACATKGYFTNTDKGVIAMVEVKNCTQEHNQVTLYAGPRNIGALSTYNINADRTIDLGWFEMICRFLLKLLELLTNFIGNLGISTIVLAILLKLFMFPLALFCKAKASLVLRFERENASQIAMIEKTFAKDRLKQQEEISKFYNSHGVSIAQKSIEMIPGILSIFLFFPAYSFAKYEIFYKAPFLFWIKDLSAADPYMVMPGLLGLFIFSKLFNDDTIKQLGIFAFMLPIFFMYMFSGAPVVMVLWIMTSFSLDLAEKAVAAKILKV